MGTSVSGKRIAVLGAGKMGSILLQALLKERLLSAATTTATVQHADRARALTDKLKIPVGTNNVAAVRKADIIFVCVKPPMVVDVVKEIRAAITPKQLVISVAASVPTHLIEGGLRGNIPVIRAMPNTPALVDQGMAAVSPGRSADAAHLEEAAELLRSCGRVVQVAGNHSLRSDLEAVRAAVGAWLAELLS